MPSVPAPLTLTPTSLEEAAEAVRSTERLRIVGEDSKRAWRVAGEEAPATLRTDRLTGIVAHDVADQVVVVRAGTRLQELDEELRRSGQCIPHGSWPRGGTVGGALAMNLPHPLESATGTWRDWLLGLTLVTAQGEIVKAGARVVKSVAGYDVHKLMIGARGTLGVIVEATLRTSPVGAVPAERLEGWGSMTDVNLIHRVLPRDWESAYAHYPESKGDPRNGTIWAVVDENYTFERYEHDWLLHAGQLRFSNATASLMRRTKAIFDPEGRLEPGAMGIF
jgi:glycolate oxidase FAD binding subunit